MTLQKLSSVDEYLQIIDIYKSKEGKSNDYLQRNAEQLIAENRLFVFRDTPNAYLFVKNPIGLRLYYYINDFNKTPDFSELKDVVIEILYRSEKFYPQEEIDFFQKIGFSINLIRDQYFGAYKDFRESRQSQNILVEFAKTTYEVEQATELFNASFDNLSGNYIPQDEVAELFKTNSIFVAKDCNGKFLGALHQSYVGKIANLAHVAVISEARGKGVGSALLDAFIEKNKEIGNEKFSLWVQKQNLSAVNMYQKKGFKNTMKSTISLLKRQ